MNNQPLMPKKDASFSNWMRDFYNKKSKRISPKGYEYARWFSTKNKRRQHALSTKSLLHHMKNIPCTKCLEIGCGPGTWSRLLLDRYPHAHITSLDISQEMINQHKLNIRSPRNTTIVNNFLDHKFNQTFDFIFFSRSIEYIPNKPLVIKKLHSLLETGGTGLIVTSPPHPLMFSLKRLIGKKPNLQHTQRISAHEMKTLLKKEGFTNIKLYPILFSDSKIVPTTFLFNHFYTKKWNAVSRLFATSYLATFRKP